MTGPSSSSSSPTSSSSTTAPQHAPRPKPSSPTQILPSPLAQTYSLVHPLLLVSLFALRFPVLVDDPPATLLAGLAPVTVLQVVYVVLCLPAAGREAASSSSSSSSSSGKSGGRGAKRRGDAGSAKDGISGKVFTALLALSLVFLLGTPLLSVVLVLFGAPVTSHLTHTLLCAAHMALLAGPSLIYVHGTDGSAWHEIWGATRVLDTVWAGAVGTGVGAWFGAVPIPLDWDRAWQAYPITIVTGAYIGYAIGCAAGRTPLLYGKRIQFSNSEHVETETQVTQ